MSRTWTLIVDWLEANWDKPLFQMAQGVLIGAALVFVIWTLTSVARQTRRTTMSEWISVKDALPESVYEINDGLMSSKPVVVYGFDGDDRVYGVAQYLTDLNDKDWSEWDGMMVSVNDAMYCHITHWCPIPDPPQEVDDVEK